MTVKINNTTSLVQHNAMHEVLNTSSSIPSLPLNYVNDLLKWESNANQVRPVVAKVNNSSSLKVRHGSSPYLQGSRYSLESCEPSLCSSILSEDDDWSIESPYDSLFTDEDQHRKLRFAEPLVTDVWTRPRTPRAFVSNLFYSAEEISQFRERYYDYIEEDEQELEDADALNLYNKSESSENDLSESSNVTKFVPTRKLISKVLVMHEGEARLFQNHEKEENPSSNFDTSEFWNGSLTFWY